MGPKRNREVNIFNVSMLDVITGALGAFLILTALSVPFLPAKQLEAELDKAQNTVVELSSTLVKLTEPANSVNETSTEDVRDAFIAAQADLTERQARIESLQANLSSALEKKPDSLTLEVENQQLRTQVQQLSSVQQELAVKTQELSQVQAELSTLALRVPQTTLEAPLPTNTPQNNTLLSQTEAAELINQNSQLNILLATSQINESNLKTEVTTLQTELQTGRETLTQLETELQIAQSRIADIALVTPQADNTLTPELRANLELELQTQNETVFQLETQLATLSQVASENTALEQELQRLRAINEATLASSSNQNALQNELANLNSAFVELERNKLSLDANFQVMQNELNLAKAQRDSLVNDFAQLQEQLNNSEINRTAQTQTLAAQSQELAIQAQELGTLRLLQQSLESQNTSAVLSSQQTAQLASTLQTQLDQSQALVTQLSQEKQLADTRLSELERERDILNAQIATNTATNQGQAQENQTLAASLASLTSERDIIQAQLNQSTTDSASYAQALSDRQATIDSLQAQVNELSLQASQANTAQTQVQSYQQQTTSLTQQLADLQRTMSQVTAERDNLQLAKSSLETSLDQAYASAAASAASASASAAAANATNSLFAMISWDKPADVDLTVIDPNGLNFNAADTSAYRQDAASGAEILIDSQRGPGSEIWYTPVIKAGTYKVRANVYAPRLAGDDEPIPVNINLVHQNNGRRATALAVDLQYFTRNCMEVAHINVDASGQLSINQVMQPCGAKEDNTPKNYLQGIDGGAGN